MNKIVVIGIGNPLLCDDSAGLHAVARLRGELGDSMGTTIFCERYSGGMELLDDLAGSTHALIIDCIINPAIPPGSAAELSWEEIQCAEQERFAASHGLNLPTVVALGRKCGLPMPQHISIIAIGGEDFTRFSETPTAPVETGIEKALVLAKQRVLVWSTSAQWHRTDMLAIPADIKAQTVLRETAI